MHWPHCLADMFTNIVCKCSSQSISCPQLSTRKNYSGVINDQKHNVFPCHCHNSHILLSHPLLIQSFHSTVHSLQAKDPRLLGLMLFQKCQNLKISVWTTFYNFVQIGTTISQNFQNLSGPQNQPFEQHKTIWIKETASL